MNNFPKASKVSESCFQVLFEFTSFHLKRYRRSDRQRLPFNHWAGPYMRLPIKKTNCQCPSNDSQYSPPIHFIERVPIKVYLWYIYPTIQNIKLCVVIIIVVVCVCVPYIYFCVYSSSPRRRTSGVKKSQWTQLTFAPERTSERQRQREQKYILLYVR